MVAIGFVLLVLSGFLAAGIVLNNREPVEAEAFGVSLDNASIGGLFLVGMVVGVIAMLGLAMMLSGAVRRRAKRVAVKREVRDVRDERETLAEENTRLQAELERATPTAAAVPAAPSPGTPTTTTAPTTDPTMGKRTGLPGHGDGVETTKHRA